MKITSLFILCLLFAATAKSQKLLRPQIDKITGDTTFSTSEERIYIKLSWTGGETDIVYTHTFKIKSGHYLAFRLNITNGRNSSVYSIPNGAKAYIKLLDGSIIELLSLIGQVSDSHVIQTSGFVTTNTQSNSIPYYALTQDVENKLRKIPVTMIRIETSQGEKDFEIKDKNSYIIGKEISLIQ